MGFKKGKEEFDNRVSIKVLVLLIWDMLQNVNEAIGARHCVGMCMSEYRVNIWQYTSDVQCLCELPELLFAAVFFILSKTRE